MSYDATGDRVVAPGIVVNPDRCSGAPTIQGTRIFADTVAALARDCDGWETLTFDYGITVEQGRQALNWANAGRAGAVCPESGVTIPECGCRACGLAQVAYYRPELAHTPAVASTPHDDSHRGAGDQGMKQPDGGAGRNLGGGA